MKQSIILWTGAVFITFLAGYINSVNSPYFPYSSTIGMEGKKVTFYLERKLSSDNPNEIIIRTDIDSIKGFINWKDSNGDWNKSELIYNSDNKILKGEIPPSKPKIKSEVYINLIRNGKEYRYPPEGTVEVVFLGELKRGFGYTYYIFLFAALLLSARAGLEVFRNKKLKALSIFATIGIILWGIILVPVKNTFELFMPGEKIPSFNEIFDFLPFIIVLVWIIGIIGIFNTNKRKEFALAASVLSIILFIFY